MNKHMLVVGFGKLTFCSLNEKFCDLSWVFCRLNEIICDLSVLITRHIADYPHHNQP